MAPGGRQIYKQANKPDNFRVTATTKETKWNNVRGGQGTTLNEMVKEGLPEEATVESSMRIRAGTLAHTCQAFLGLCKMVGGQ